MRTEVPSFYNHTGYSLAVDISAMDISKIIAEVLKDKAPISTEVLDYPSCVTSNASTFVHAIEQKSLYFGEIQGIIEVLRDLEDETGMKKVVNHLITKFRTLIDRAKKRLPIDINMFTHNMYQTVAFITAQQQVLIRIISLVAK